MSLPQALRLRSKQDFARIFRRGKRRHFGVAFVLTFKDAELRSPRVGVVVSKKVFKKAKDRNYLRRIVKHCLYAQKDKLSQRDIVWVAQPKFSKLERSAWYATVQQQVAELEQV